MPLKQREKSSTGIYHVMFRGINKQDIFFNEEDYVRMQTILRDAPFVKLPDGKIISDGVCTIYAYCILGNHVHLLIKEGTQTISQIIKSIELRYSKYYNIKYERVGHLFQGRFPSEPVNDEIYFHTLLRYIHRNSVKAMESPTPEDYPYCSWNEYVNHPSNTIRVLRSEAIEYVLSKYPLQELTEWVNTDKDDHCLDMTSFKNIITDKDALEIIQDLSGIDNPEDFRLLDAPTQIFYLLQAIDKDVSIRQAARLGTITRYQLEQAYQQKKSNAGPPPSTLSDTGHEEKIEIANEMIKHIPSLGKKTYHKLHLIVEYLHDRQSSKCSEISNAIEVSQEQVRKYLIILSNSNIVTIQGEKRARTYSLK